MTIQQEAQNLISKMSDDSVRLVLELISHFSTDYAGVEHFAFSTETIDVSKRIGIGRGIVEDPTDFDKWDEEIATVFEESAV